MLADSPADEPERPDNWIRPFIAGYSCHTANFVSAQILVWSRLLFLVGFDILYISDLMSALVLLAGIALSVPYTLTIFREAELVVDGGPSLINGLIPEWLTTLALLLITIFLGLADSSFGGHRFSLTWSMYMLAAVGSLVFAILSKSNHKERSLVSTAALLLCMNLPSVHFDLALRIVPSTALLVSYVFDAMDVKSNRSVLGALELSAYRFRMMAKLGLAVCMLFQVTRYITLVAVLILVGSDLVLFFAERRLGDVSHRQHLRTVPVRRTALQVTD